MWTVQGRTEEGGPSRSSFGKGLDLYIFTRSLLGVMHCFRTITKTGGDEFTVCPAPRGWTGVCLLRALTFKSGGKPWL